MLDSTCGPPRNPVWAATNRRVASVNSTNATIQISITSDTLRQSGTTNTGTRTLAVYGEAYVKKVAATTWHITGNIT